MKLFKPTISQLKKYPHMAPADIEVWEHFLTIFPNLYQNVRYDVRVGKGIPPAKNLSPEMIRDWSALTQKRIDVVAFNPEAIYIIELKGTATVSAPGQALAYAILFRQTFKPTLPIKPVLIFHYASPDVLHVADQLHVQTIHIPF